MLSKKSNRLLSPKEVHVRVELEALRGSSPAGYEVLEMVQFCRFTCYYRLVGTNSKTQHSHKSLVITEVYQNSFVVNRIFWSPF